MPVYIETIKTIDDIDCEIMGTNPLSTILFFDIDNTILRVKTDIFSDEWVKWQEHIFAETNGQHEHCAAKTLSGIFSLYDRWLNTSNYEIEVLERCTREFIDKYTSLGFKVILITARSKIESTITFKHVSTHYNVGNFYQDISYEDKDVLFKHGILYTGGKNKGVHMSNLLTRIGRPGNIFFIDDSLRECINVASEFENSSINMRIYHYIFSQKFKDLFDRMDKDSLHQKLLAYKIDSFNKN